MAVYRFEFQDSLSSSKEQTAVAEKAKGALPHLHQDVFQNQTSQCNWILDILGWRTLFIELSEYAGTNYRHKDFRTTETTDFPTVLLVFC
jgi:hypothetical protein